MSGDRNKITPGDWVAAFLWGLVIIGCIAWVIWEWEWFDWFSVW